MSRTTLKSEATAPRTRKVPFVRTALRLAMIAAILGLGGLSLSKVMAQDHGGPKVELHNQAGPDNHDAAKTSSPAPAQETHGATDPAAPAANGPAATHDDTTTEHADEAKTDPAHKVEEEKREAAGGHAEGGHAEGGHAEGGHAEGAGAHGGGEHKEAPFSIHLPTWISGVLKNYFWHKGPATVELKGAVTADGQKAENLVGQTITFDYEDPHHPGHPEKVTAKISAVGDNTEGEHTATADVNGQPVTIIQPEVIWQLEKMFPEALIISWWTALVVIAIALWMVKGLQRVPSKKQALAETIYEAFDNFVKQLIGPTYKKYVPLIVGAFIYIFSMNVAGLFPGWASPTANINITAGMALVVMVYVQYEGIRENGFIGYLKHFVGEPAWLFPLNFPLHIIGEFAKLLSLTIRLFGNIFGEDVVIVILLYLAVKFTQGWVPVHVLMYFFGLFTSFVQAMVFSILTCVYIAMMTVHEDHGHGHGHEEHGQQHGHAHEVAPAH